MPDQSSEHQKLHLITQGQITTSINETPFIYCQAPTNTIWQDTINFLRAGRPSVQIRTAAGNKADQTDEHLEAKRFLQQSEQAGEKFNIDHRPNDEYHILVITRVK